MPLLDLCTVQPDATVTSHAFFGPKSCIGYSVFKLLLLLTFYLLNEWMNEWMTLCSPTSNSLSYPVGSHQLWPSWQPCTSVGASACGGRRRWCCGWRSVWRKCCVASMPTILKWRTVRTSQYLLTSVFTHLSLSYVFSHVGQTRRCGANTWCRPAFETT